MQILEAYVKWKLLQYPLNMWWRSRYRLLVRERAERKVAKLQPKPVSYEALIQDGT